VGNELDETVGPVNPGGRDVNVIDKRLFTDDGVGVVGVAVAG
jgi:hypothetical protein